MVDRVVVVAFTKVDFDLYGYSGPFQSCNEDLHMGLCSYLVRSGPLDTGSRPNVVDD